MLSGYCFCPIIKVSNSAEKWRKMSCDNTKLDIVNNTMYAKYDPNPSILSQDIERKPIWGIHQGPLTLLKWILDLCANNMHIFRPRPNHLWSFKTIGLKLQEELQSQDTHWLFKTPFPCCLRLSISWFNWWVSFAPEFQCCYFCEPSCLFYLSFNFDFYVSKIMH